MTIDEFEFMIEVCKVKSITITSLIDLCSKGDASSSTQKFNVMMHLHELHPEGTPDRDIIKKTRDHLFDGLIESMKASNHHWNGRLAEYLAIKKYLLG